jgi:hypothetical protein
VAVTKGAGRLGATVRGERRPSARQRRPEKTAMDLSELGEVRSRAVRVHGRRAACDDAKERREEGGGRRG